MRAARLHEYTDDMTQGLSIDDVEKPQITTSDGVVVAVEGAGWCQTDNHIIEGISPTPGVNAGVCRWNSRSTRVMRWA